MGALVVDSDPPAGGAVCGVAPAACMAAASEADGDWVLGGGSWPLVVDVVVPPGLVCEDGMEGWLPPSCCWPNDPFWPVPDGVMPPGRRAASGLAEAVVPVRSALAAAASAAISAWLKM